MRINLEDDGLPIRVPTPANQNDGDIVDPATERPEPGGTPPTQTEEPVKSSIAYVKSTTCLARRPASRSHDKKVAPVSPQRERSRDRAAYVVSGKDGSSADRPAACRASVPKDSRHVAEVLPAEDGTDASVIDKPGFRRFLRAAADGRLKAVFIFDIDQIGRPGVSLTLLREELRELGIGVGDDVIVPDADLAQGEE